jgi:dipeptidyl aminopeptidase/acylaminoacyl peptidase
VQRLTRGDFHIDNFDWSPDGQTIVFDHKPNPKINTSRMGYDISVVPSDSGAVKMLIGQAGSDGNPKFSPDGKYIAFVSDGGQPEPIGLGDLYIIKAEGGEMMAAPHTPDRSAGLWGWTADSKGLLFAEAYHTNRNLMMMPVGDVLEGKKGMGKAKMLLPKKGVSGSADYNPNTGQLAFVYQNTDQPAELYVSSMDGASPKAITTINSEIELPKMGKTELIKWTSKDGMEVEGLLTYPVDYEPGKKYPGILQIHGGPAGVFTESFTGNPSIYLTQYFAEQGFFVLRPNPRGSSGYGKDFRYANFQDWGYGDYEDLMSGMDKIIEDGLVDEEKQVAMGWSYGGYMTSFLVTKTNRFKAASMGAGLPNLISMTTTTDIPDYLVGHMGGEFWDDYETYEKHSAMYRIKNVKTPTQVIHGANDLRVPFTQGQEFYVALDRLGVDTEMIVLPRTPHGPREPKLLMQVSPRIMGWFEKYFGEGTSLRNNQIRSGRCRF